MPSAKEERHAQTADCEHADVFGHKERGVLESGIFGHVAGDDFGFAFRYIKRSPVRFHQAGNKKQKEGGSAPRRKNKPVRHETESVTALSNYNFVGIQ